MNKDNLEKSFEKAKKEIVGQSPIDEFLGLIHHAVKVMDDQRDFFGWIIEHSDDKETSDNVKSFMFLIAKLTDGDLKKKILALSEGNKCALASLAMFIIGLGERYNLQKEFEAK